MKYEPDINEPRISEEHDGEIEQLLGDAYDAPVVPTSLLRRLDDLITQEWGQSPQLVDPRVTLWRRSMTIATPWFKAARIAACIALVVGAVMIFGRGTPAYAWSSMIHALEKQGVVQLDGPGVKRWLSMSEGVLSEQSDRTLTLLDTRQQIILERNQQDPQIRRRVLPAQWTGSNR